MRRLAGVAISCIVLFSAILAGYWGLLDAERVRGLEDGVGPSTERTQKPQSASDDRETISTTPRSDVILPGSTSTLDTARAPESAGPANVLPDEPSSGQTQKDREEASEKPAGPPASAPPTFDVVRVEPDGSTVLAGRAPADSKVRLLDGAAAIGSDTANGNGEFVVILDEKLGVGPHEIRIEAKRADGLGVTSQETAIVNVPEKGRGEELLAMVEKPGEASRLISIPKSPDAVAGTSASPDGGTLLPDENGLQGKAAPAPALSPTPQAPSGEARAMDKAETDAQETALLPKAPARNLAALGVEAVEIEGDLIYVAGRASEGAKVRVYFDERFLAEDHKVAGGRFLVKAQSPVPTGTHTVRADEVGPGGSVVARVEVPFFKPEGRTMSALALPAEEHVASDETDAAELPIVSPAATNASADGEAQGESMPAMTEGPAVPPVSPAPIEGRASNDDGSSMAQDPLPVAPLPPHNSSDQSEVATETAPSMADVRSLSNAENASGDSAMDQGIAVTHQPELVPVDTRVIIRRGDTLWRISRETYGQGARYTVIYLANGDQIRDPNRIYPGQVFRMPKDEDPAAQDAPRG